MCIRDSPWPLGENYHLCVYEPAANGQPRGGPGKYGLYLVDAFGSMATADQLEKVTTSPVFDGFAMFSPDGKQLIWASNRNAKTTGETNVFVADFKWE